MIDFLELGGFCGEERSPGNYPDTGLPAAGDDLPCGFALYAHCTHERAVGPGQIFGGELPNVQVHQTAGVVSGQHRGHGQKAEGRMGSLLVDEPQCVPEAPEGIRKLGV